MVTSPVLLLILLLVVLEHTITFFRCCDVYCFNLVYQLSVPFPYLAAYYGFVTPTFISKYITLILVSRCECVRIASIVSTCAWPFPTSFAMCASQEQSFEISTPRCVYWSAIGTSSSRHFHLKVTRFTLSWLHTTTAHFFTFGVSPLFLVYYFAFSICFGNP